MDFDSVFIFSNDCLVLLSISRYRRNSNLFFLLDIVGPFETEFAYCHASGQWTQAENRSTVEFRTLEIIEVLHSSGHRAMCG